MENPYQFSVDGLALEALIDEASDEKAVVITHPHPLYGGAMNNPVVDGIRQAYQARGYSTLRFNFRGTGHSMGEHDGGQGEIRDVLAAGNSLKHMGYKTIDLAGYSFGAWVNLMATRHKHPFERLILISPPVDFIPFETISGVESLSLVISGENDDYASPEHIKKQLKNWNKHAIFIEIPGADHFYSGQLGLMKETLQKQL